MGLFNREFSRQGAPPGSFAETAGRVEPRIIVKSYSESELEEYGFEGVDGADGAVAVLAPDRVTWIDIQGLGDGSVVQRFGELLDLHPLSVSDVVNTGQRPKVDAYEQHLYVVLRMVTLDSDGELVWEQVSLYVGDTYVLTFQESYDDCLGSLRDRLRGGRKQIRSSGSDYLACAVIDAIVDGYFPVLEHYGDLLERFEDRILEEGDFDVLSELYVTRRDLAGFRRSTWPLRDALGRLAREEDDRLGDVSRLHLRDTLDHVVQVVEVNESYRELAATLVDVHLSMVGQRTNEIMRVLTVVSAIFIPLTFIAGIYGMNFDTRSPFNLPELGWTYGYPFFWGICALLGLSLLVLFRRLGWLGGPASR